MTCRLHLRYNNTQWWVNTYELKMNNNSENKIKGKNVNQNLSVRVLLRNSSLVFSEGFMALMKSASRVSNLGRE